MLRERQRVLLYALGALAASGKRATKTFLDKLLFLTLKETNMVESVKFYNFFPYRYGPYSKNFDYELADLQSRGLVKPDLTVSEEGLKLAEKLPETAKQAFLQVEKRFANTKSAVDYVYANYPQYTVLSKLVEHDKKLNKPAGLFSIGYEGRDVDSFLDCLVQNSIEVVADVRKNPFSMNYAFTKSKLVSSLKSVGIGYVHFPELGIPGEYRKNLESQQDYEELFEFYKREILPSGKEKTRELADLVSRQRVALLCFESDKNCCHRGVLAKALEELSGKEVVHL